MAQGASLPKGSLPKRGASPQPVTRRQPLDPAPQVRGGETRGNRHQMGAPQRHGDSRAVQRSAARHG